MQHRSRWSIVRAALALTCMLAVASCDTPLDATVDGVDRIVLTPSTASVQAGATVTLEALVLDASGNAMRERKVVWASENASIATVSQSGVVTGIAGGNVQIAASSGGKSANATITVTSRPVSLVRVTPGSATIAVSQSTTLQAEALDAAGEKVLGRPVAWSSSNETIALVSASGIVAGIAPGNVTISATIDGQTGTAAITVAPQAVASVSITPEVDTTAVGQRLTLRATPLDARNLPLTGRTIAWSSSSPAIATVSSAGEVLGLSVGTAKIRATVDGQFAEATIVVQPVPVARIVAAPTQVTLNPGQTSQLTVTLTDSAGNVLTGRSISYTTNDAQIATVSATGLVTAVAQGTAQITVSSESQSATVTVTVNAVPVASIRITPTSVSLRISQTARFAAQAFDAQGRQLLNRTFTWISGAPSVATVNQAGDVTAVGTGTAAIFAATEGVSGSATVTVTTVPVASVQVSPATLSLQQGGSSQLTVVVKDAAGNVLTGRPIIWASSNDAIAVVSSTGRVTAVAAGSAVITATSETVAGTCNVTVSNVPVASVTITPTNPTLSVGQTLGMTATMRDAGGNILSGRAVTWASQNQAVATVDAQGVVTAVASGSATIVATSEGINGSTLINVSTIPVARVDVAPTTVSLNPGQTSQLTATAYDANNNVLVRPVTWVSSNTAVATVSASGLVTAVASGNATISATSGGVTGTALITVALVPVASVTVTPSAPNMFPNDVLQLTATAQDAGGNVITGRPTTWSSSNTNVATVTSTGLVTAVTQGAATITATVDGVSGTSTVSINATPVASVTLTPASASILQGEQTAFIAVARDAGGNVLSRPITWSSTSPSIIVNVTQSGVVTGINPGTEGVIATAVGAGAGSVNVADTSSVTVSLVPVASMTISPDPVSLFTGQQQTLTLQLFDSIGGSLSATGRTITWVSRDPAIVTVSASGQVAGIAPGTTRVVVSTPGATATVFDSVNVTVAAAPIASITVQPSTSTIYHGATKSLRAVVVDGFGATVRGRNITWTSCNPALVTVSAVGGTPDSATYTTVGSGTGATCITAQDPSGLSNQAAITVAPVPVTSVVVTPASATVDLSLTTQLSAAPQDSAGNTLSRTITWVSLAPGIASVDATGLVTGVAAGTATIQARANGAGVGGADVVGTSAITVNVPVNSVTVTSPRSFIVPGDTMHLTVVLRDVNNNVLTGRPITFASNSGSVSVDAQGILTGGSPGAATITAASEGKNGTVNVSSIAGIAAMSVIGPDNNIALDTLLLRTQTKTYTVTVTDGSGNGIAGHSLAVSSSNASAMTVSAASVTTNASGQATVNVTAGPSTGSATITFTAARAGAIPPGAPGSNSRSASIHIVVP